LHKVLELSSRCDSVVLVSTTKETTMTIHTKISEALMTIWRKVASLQSDIDALAASNNLNDMEEVKKLCRALWFCCSGVIDPVLNDADLKIRENDLIELTDVSWSPEGLADRLIALHDNASCTKLGK
jgi:hypothetical protein